MYPLSPLDAMRAHVSIRIGEILGVPMKGYASHYQESGIEFLIPEQGRYALGRRIMERISDKAFTDHIVHEGLAACNQLLKVAEPFLESKQFTNEELADRYEKYCRVLGESMAFGYLANLLDYASEELDNVLLAELERRVFSKVSDKRLAVETLVALTSPEQPTLPFREHVEFLCLAEEFFKIPEAKKILTTTSLNALPSKVGERFSLLAKRVEAHRKKWEWLSFLYVGPVKWDRAYFYKLLLAMAREGQDPALERERLEEQPKRMLAARKKVAKLCADDAHFYAARQLSHLKAVRKDTQVHSYYYLDGFFRHLARQFDLSPTQARFHTSEEIVRLLRGTIPPKPAEANERFKESFWYCWEGKSEILTGRKAKEASEKVRRPEVKSSEEVKGSCACPGHAQGQVKIVNSAAEAEKVLPGDVLVSVATNPELISAMRIASAIVTDMGGLTCHAAIVARELNIPCVIGTKNATRSFKDGDHIDVNATQGWARKTKS